MPLGVNPAGSGSRLTVAPCNFKKSDGLVRPAALPAVGMGVGTESAQAERWEGGMLYKEEEGEEAEDGGRAFF